MLSSNYESCRFSTPLRIGDAVVGDLCVSSRTPRVLTERERNVLERLAEMAAAALDSARMRDDERQVAVLEERSRLSRELHDSLAQVLAYLRVRAVAVRGTVSRGDQATATAELDEMALVALEAYRDTREAILGLRESVSSEDGLTAALREYGQKFSRQSGIAVRVELEGREPPPLPGEAEVQLIRVIQEALTNVRKHAGAEQVTIRVSHAAGATSVAVTDDGCGFNPEALESSETHFGLRTMKERMACVGGSLAIHSSPGRGTTARITIGVPNGKSIGAGTIPAEQRPATTSPAAVRAS